MFDPWDSECELMLKSAGGPDCGDSSEDEADWRACKESFAARARNLCDASRQVAVMELARRASGRTRQHQADALAGIFRAWWLETHLARPSQPQIWSGIRWSDMLFKGGKPERPILFCPFPSLR